MVPLKIALLAWDLRTAQIGVCTPMASVSFEATQKGILRQRPPNFSSDSGKIS